MGHKETTSSVHETCKELEVAGYPLHKTYLVCLTVNVDKIGDIVEILQIFDSEIDRLCVDI